MRRLIEGGLLLEEIQNTVIKLFLKVQKNIDVDLSIVIGQMISNLGFKPVKNEETF